MAADRFKPLLDRSFLRGALEYEFQDYLSDGHDAPLLERLNNWLKRDLKKESQTQGNFIQCFFVDTWGYKPDGTGSAIFNLKPEFPIAATGQTGGKGKADLGIGNFGNGQAEIPQIVCEFKDIHSGLDNKQNRKGNNRSPVQQAQDYLWGARRGVALNAPVQPRFAIVTDMNEFRLYWSENMPERYVRFKIGNPKQQLEFDDILALSEGTGEDAQFDRFLFWFLFKPSMLLSNAGRTQFERLVERQGKIEEKLEGKFYEDYRNYRKVLIDNIMLQDVGSLTRSGKVRLGQKLLDRLIFIMFAEDMGGRVGFPSSELQSQLIRFSEDTMLEGDGQEVWTRLKQIFNRMNTGGDIGSHKIHQFNGGLFRDDQDIDSLKLPNHIFVVRGQGQNPANISEHKQTLLYLAATYNFAKEGDAKNSIGLYTLGHIFEQSIVELEKLEADADERPSLTDVTKRKRDGVYYTPEWAVRRIIEETIDPLFAKWKSDAGWAQEGDPSKAAAMAYWDRLTKIKVIDPACGSGAFLIVALKHLEREFAAAADAAVTAKAIPKRPSEAEITEMILVNNLFGVDINPASVEITRLSLWLHTAQANKPLSSLDSHIACGNSLIDSRFYNKRDLMDAEERDRINTFDWEGDFASGSFDAVIGNPPYVKLQNFVKVHADMAAWLERGSTGERPYQSTTKNWDLYLPFIEKGLALLGGDGRMGYIAPNLWPTLEYGEGLRGLIHKGRHLEKWLDFRSFQVFEEATVYTSIQIFSKAPVEEIKLAFAGDGDISRVEWTDDDYILPYDAIALPLKPWLIAPAPVRTMIERLGKDGTPLGHSENTNQIFQGIITSADHIYHLRRIGKDRFAYTPRAHGKKQAEVVVEIEQGIMKPLISGAEAKRFLEPETDTYLLFPYRVMPDVTILLTPDELAFEFPKAWKYLQLHEKELRAREGNKFNDDKWYRMGRTQNLDKQEVPKLLVAQLVPELRVCFDDQGKFYANNVRVNGILPRGDNGWFLTGLLNSPVSNYIFKWLGKPKDNGYFEANKQFIAPLPIPKVDGTSRAGLTALAKRLQQRCTSRMDMLAQLAERLSTTARTPLPLEHMLPDVDSIPQIELNIPKSVPKLNRKAWVDNERTAQEEAARAQLDGIIRLDSEMTVELSKGKLSFLIDEREVAKLFVESAEAALIEAQWRCIALDFTPTGKGDGKRLIDRLRKVAKTAEPAVAKQIIAIGKDLADLSNEIKEDEKQLHELTCGLFKLTDGERALIDASRR
jgi:hypothetical protein